MATGTLTSTTIAATYKSLLKVKGGLNAVLHATTHALIEDGDGNDTVLSLAIDSVGITGSGKRLYFHDKGGEYIAGDGTNLTITAGGDIDLDCTTADINANATISGTLGVTGITTISNTTALGLADNSGARLQLLGSSSNKNWLVANQETGGFFEITPSTSNGNSTFTTPAVVILNDSKVGIGHITPATLLSVGSLSNALVAGEVQVSAGGLNVNMTEDNKYAAGIKNQHAGGGGLVIWGGDSVNEYSLRVEDYDGAKNMFCVRGDGYVGIGSDTPLSQLDILGPAATNPIVSLRPSSSNEDYSSTIRFIDTSTDNFVGGYIQYDSLLNQLILGTHNTSNKSVGSDIECIALDRVTGSVGIGTPLSAVPNTALEIRSDAATVLRIHRPNGDQSTGEPVGIGFSLRADANQTTSDIRAGLYSHYSGDIYIAADNSATDMATNPEAYVKMMVKGATGNVGIGNPAPGNKLEVSSTGAGVALEISAFSGTDGHQPELILSKSGNDGYNSSISTANEEVLGLIDFRGVNASNAVKSSVQIRAEQVGSDADSVRGILRFYTSDSDDAGTPTERMVITAEGAVGIGTVLPANPLAVNRSGDGVIVDFESADAVEGTVSISGATTSYNAFVGSHYTQLKDGQSDLPVGSVVMSTGEIITCNLVTEAIEAVAAVEAVEAVYETVTKQRQKVVVTEVEEEQTSTGIVKEGGKYIQKTTTKTVTSEVSTLQYDEVKLYDEDGEEIGTHQLEVMEDYKEEVLVSRAIEAVEGVAAVPATTTNVPNKEYFTYTNTTTTASDPAVYGTWMGKMSDDATGHSFGDDAKPIYLVAQVGLYKIRVTDTNGNISKGDYLESSTRAMEGQKQTSTAKVNSTIGKAMIAVDWSSVSTDSDLGYKWKLIPCTF
jgi:hypothetical protein